MGQFKIYLLCLKVVLGDVIIFFLFQNKQRLDNGPQSFCRFQNGVVVLFKKRRIESDKNLCCRCCCCCVFVIVVVVLALNRDNCDCALATPLGARRKHTHKTRVFKWARTEKHSRFAACAACFVRIFQVKANFSLIHIFFQHNKTYSKSISSKQVNKQATRCKRKSNLGLSLASKQLQLSLFQLSSATKWYNE